MVGYNYEQSTFERSGCDQERLIFPEATNISLALGQAITTVGGYEKWAILGGFSRLNYSYKDRYLLEVNARYDGSSKFPSNQRYAFFPSVSAGWRISKEAFWNVSPKIISNLKIRASYGSLGNGNINSYVYQKQYSISSVKYYTERGVASVYKLYLLFFLMELPGKHLQPPISDLIFQCFLTG